MPFQFTCRDHADFEAEHLLPAQGHLDAAHDGLPYHAARDTGVLQFAFTSQADAQRAARKEA